MGAYDKTIYNTGCCSGDSCTSLDTRRRSLLRIMITKAGEVEYNDFVGCWERLAIT